MPRAEYLVTRSGWKQEARSTSITQTSPGNSSFVLNRILTTRMPYLPQLPAQRRTSVRRSNNEPTKEAPDRQEPLPSYCLTMESNYLLSIYLYRHEAAGIRWHVYHTDLDANARQRNTGPAIVANRGIRFNPVALGIVKGGIGFQTTIALHVRGIDVQADLVGLLRAKGCIIGLNARAPDLAVVGAQEQTRMCIDRQEEAAATPGGTVVADIVIYEGVVEIP